jgi:hypothetical protein
MLIFFDVVLQRSAAVSAAIRLFFSPTRYLTRSFDIASLPHRNSKSSAAQLQCALGDTAREPSALLRQSYRGRWVKVVRRQISF